MNNSSEIGPATITRRDFVRATAPAAAFAVMPAARAFGSVANSALSIGIIGSGWRGHHLMGILKRLEGGAVRVAALADPFQDQLDAGRARYPEDEPRLFRGLDGYQDVLASGVDAVLITSPPYFHPEQFEAAVDAGVHAYLEKPVSVDAAGARRIREAGERAEGKMTVMVGFQNRGREDLAEGIARVKSGAIGPVAAGRAHYNAGPMGLKDATALDEVEQRLRNWVWDQVLSGDIIVEQNVHVLDVINWVLGSHPDRAYATASRSVRTHWGDTSDAYQAIFWYPGDVRLTFFATQFLDLPWGDSEQSFYGPDGAFEVRWADRGASGARIRGAQPWSFDGPMPDPEEVRLRTFVDSIRNGHFLNEAASGADSTLTAILARRSAERGEVVSWDELIEEDGELVFETS